MSGTKTVTRIRETGFPVSKVGPINFLTLEGETRRLSRNVGKCQCSIPEERRPYDGVFLKRVYFSLFWFW